MLNAIVRSAACFDVAELHFGVLQPFWRLSSNWACPKEWGTVGLRFSWPKRLVSHYPWTREGFQLVIVMKLVGSRLSGNICFWRLRCVGKPILGHSDHIGAQNPVRDGRTTMTNSELRWFATAKIDFPALAFSYVGSFWKIWNSTKREQFIFLSFPQPPPCIKPSIASKETRQLFFLNMLRLLIP